MAIHPHRSSLLRRWLRHQHFRRLQRRKVLWHFLVHCWLIFLFARRRCLVRQLPIWLSTALFNCHFRLGGNTAGQYKRAVAVALHIGMGNFAGAAASNIYRTEDAPGYKFGRMSPCPFVKFRFRLTFSTDWIELGFVGMGLVVLPTIFITYKRTNA